MAQGRQVRRQRWRMNPKKKGPSNKSLNKKIKNIENNLMELKFQDIFDNGDLIANTGISEYLLPIAQGDTASTRTGSVINPTSIQCRISIQTDIDQNAPCRARAILFWDKQANNAAPTLVGASTTLSLLDNTVVTDTTMSPINFNNIDRYTVLWDKLWTFNPKTNLTVVAGATTQVVAQEVVKVLRRKLGRVVKYNGTGATVASIVTNSLFIAYFTNVTTVANQPTVVASYRIYYRDS